jgi:aspartate-semialdehyde dehydrogenase
MQKDIGHRAVRVGIVGVSGAVGEEFLALLGEAALLLSEVRLYASERSAGRKVAVGGGVVEISVLSPGCFEGLDIVFFSAGKHISRQWAPEAVRAGAWAIDNSSAFRMDPSVPLVIPGVNDSALDACESPCIVAVPNCSTIVALVAVTPLHRIARVSRMVISTYQAVSGAGAAAMRELEAQAHDYAHGRPLKSPIFGRPCLFNCFSHNSAIGESGYNEEEAKLLHETRKIWSDSEVRVTATCVRVPVLRAHCEAISLEFASPLSPEAAREALANSPGIKIVDDRAANAFPEPIAAAGRDPVLVGRIRGDWSLAPGMGLSLFVAGDQIRIGAALTGLNIARAILRRSRVPT